MRTTADPTSLFRRIDATDIGEDSYTFNVSDGGTRTSAVPEGEEIPREELDIREVEVTFDDYDDNNREQLALDAIRRDAQAVVAGDVIDTDYEYDVLFIDRDESNAYLVNTYYAGYECVREENDDGDAIKGGFSIIYPDACLRVR